MKYHHIFILAAVFMLASTNSISAQVMRPGSYQELVDTSDLVVIAMPTSTSSAQLVLSNSVHDLPESAILKDYYERKISAVKPELTFHEGNLPFTNYDVYTVETKFAISAVLKGDKEMKEFILHHYLPGSPLSVVRDAISLGSFDPTKKRTFLLFLVRESDGRYAPTRGQTDPEMGIKVLEDSEQHK
jgi:hypothetical protein